MTRCDGGELRDWRRSRGWDVPELARQLRRTSGEPVAARDGLVRMIRAWERGDHHPSERYELLYRKLGLPPARDHDQPEGQQAQTASQEDSGPVRRRTFVELAGISAAATLLPAPADTRPPLDTEPLALALTAQMTGSAPEPTQEPLGIAALTLSVTRARRHYQACRYAELLPRLPQLLAQLDAACDILDGDDKLRAYALAGDAYHLAAGILLVAPATYNTICKWAQGISDTYALGVLAEATGLGVPVVVLPFVNTALASRAPFCRSVESLRAEGVKILLGPGGIQPHPPRTGGNLIDTYPWHLGLDEAERMLDSAPPKP